MADISRTAISNTNVANLSKKMKSQGALPFSISREACPIFLGPKTACPSLYL